MEFSSGNTKHFGLQTIFTNEEVIDRSNIEEVISSAVSSFTANREQIKELKQIFTGDQAILSRPQGKTSTNEKVNINLLPAIINDIAGLYLGEKIDYVYVSLDNEESVKKQKQEDITIINRFMRYAGDIRCDKNSLLELLITGVAYQFCGGNNDKRKPFLLTNIPSENCFAIHSTNIGFPILATCVYSEFETQNVSGSKSKKTTIYVFTDTKKYELSNETDKWVVISEENHECTTNPIQVVKLNPYALSLVAQLEGAQNALNVAMSDSINATIEQINSILAIFGAEVTKENAEQVKRTGILNATSINGAPISAQYLSRPIDENINSLRTYLFDTMLFIAGVPTQSTGGSGNNGAVAMASGFFGANIDAYFNELEFQDLKQNQIDNVISALKRRKKIKSDISSFDIEIRFDRNKLTSLKENADALSVLLASGVPPRDALKVAGIFGDVDRIANEMEQAFKEKVAMGLVKDDKTNDPKPEPKKE